MGGEGRGGEGDSHDRSRFRDTRKTIQILTQFFPLKSDLARVGLGMCCPSNWATEAAQVPEFKPPKTKQWKCLNLVNRLTRRMYKHVHVHV